METYLIPAEQTRTEIELLKSRFIATAAPVFSTEEAKAFIQSMKQEFADASHNVPAFLIGYGNSVTAHCTDDGEPSGTAGRPMLAVLKGSGLGDIVVVVTRYWGGTKLGTGGLVRAYSDAVREVLQELPRARKVPTHTVGIAVPYSFLERARLLIDETNGKILDETFANDVTIMAQYAVADFEPFQQLLSERSNGSIEALIFETNPATIMPI